MAGHLKDVHHHSSVREIEIKATMRQNSMVNGMPGILIRTPRSSSNEERRNPW